MISVVIPSYNCGRYLDQAVASVIGQQYQRTETIVVDDGSEDNTPDVMSSWLKYASVSYIRQPNRGLPAARNTGVKASSAKYVAVLDADDALAPNALELMVRSLESSSSVWCIIDIEKFWDGYSEIRRTTFPEGDLLTGILDDDFIRRAMFFRRDALHEAGMWDEDMKYREDWDLNIRMIRGGQRFDYIAQPLYRYRKRPGSITTGNPVQVLSYTRAVLQKHHRRLADAGNATAARLYSKNMWDLGRRYLYDQRDWANTLDCMRESIRYDANYARLARALIGVPARLLSRALRTRRSCMIG